MYQNPIEKLKLNTIIMSAIVRNEIKELVDIIHEQTNTILSYTDRIPQIEIDIVRENLRKLYELMRQVDKVNSNIPKEEQIVTVDLESVIHTEVKEEIKAEERVDSYLDFVANTFTNEPPISGTDSSSEETVAINESPLFTFMEVKDDEQDLFTENEISEENVGSLPSENIVEEPIVEPEVLLESELEKVEELFPEIQQELLAEEKIEDFETVENSIQIESVEITEPETLFEEKLFLVQEELVIETSTTAPVHEKEKSYNSFIGKPIDSLKKAIGINDKFQFINELFEGNMGRYNKTIESLDFAGDLNSANKIMMELASELSWDSEDKAFLQLQNYLMRRYH